MKKIQTFFLLVFELAILCLTLYYLRIGLEMSHSDDMRIIMPILVDVAFLALFASFGRRLALFFGTAPMAGKIIMGVLVGPAFFGVLDAYSVGVELARVAGVLFILFEAGLHFDPLLLKKNTALATRVAVVGVGVPLCTLGLFGYFVLDMSIVSALFLGGIFTATSVGLSVELLKRANMLQTNLGNKIVGGALIDNILGVIILTTLLKVSQGYTAVAPFIIILLVIGFFVIGTYLLWVSGVADKIAQYLDRHYANDGTQLYTRFFFGALILASAIAGVAGLEPVLGAFGIGVVLSKVDNSIKKTAWEKIEGYTHIFVGAFLVSLGTMLPREALLSWEVWLLALIFTGLGFFGKYLVKYFFAKEKDGRLVGYAMSIRGEVGLVFITVALTHHMFDAIYASAALLAVILVSILGLILFQREVLGKKGKKKLKPLVEGM